MKYDDNVYGVQVSMQCRYAAYILEIDESGCRYTMAETLKQMFLLQSAATL